MLRRNFTARDLPKNASQAKLKKNLSHGQLTRLNPQGGKSSMMQALAPSHGRTPLSPGLKGRSKRPKSADMAAIELDLHEQEVEILRQQQEAKAKQKAAPAKKVGFAMGSSPDSSEEMEDDDAGEVEAASPKRRTAIPQFGHLNTAGDAEGDDWTDQSASASPYSTRQNTANNSRRPSTAQEKPPDRRVVLPMRTSITELTVNTPSPLDEVLPPTPKLPSPEPAPQVEADGTPAQSFEDEVVPSPVIAPPPEPPAVPSPPASPKDSVPPPLTVSKSTRRSPLHAAKDHPNPSLLRLVSHQLPAPALVSNISALDDVHSTRASPTAPSIMSTRSVTGDGANDQQASTTEQDPEELVSRFMPSSSHPSSNSADNTHPTNTPKTDGFHMPGSTDHISTGKPSSTGTAPTSPGSTLSGSSSAAATPALGRSRLELRMASERAIADREAAAERQSGIPYHVYDRRNETLKSHLSLALPGNNGMAYNARLGAPHNAQQPGLLTLSFGPEMFQGRFKAVNTELRVVQKFRDPITEAVERLKKCKGTRLAKAAKAQTSPQKVQAMKMSKSAVTLPARAESVKIKTASQSAAALPPAGKSAVQIKASPAAVQRRGVSFAGPPPPMERRATERASDVVVDAGVKASADEVAKMMWALGD